jgi:hypothetical protein
MVVLKPTHILKWVLLSWLGVSAGAHAQAAHEEATLRAAMVYNLMLFVEWPNGVLSDAPEVLLCTVPGQHDIARAFAALDGQTIKNRKLAVQRRGPLSDLRDCNAVYLDGLDPDLLADKLASLAARPVLTLSSSPGSGAMIELSLSDNRLVFDVSATDLRAARLSLASRVMQLARSVRH